MAYLTGGGNDFERAIDRGIGHFRSRELDAAVAAIKSYQPRPSRAGIERVRDTLLAWRQRNPKEYANRGGPILAALRTELVQQCLHWHTAYQTPGQPEPLAAPAAAEGSQGTRAWVDAVKPRLDELGTFACADAYSYTTYDKATDSYDYGTGFAACINPSRRALVERRYREMKQRGAGTANIGDAMYVRGGDWDAGNYARVHAKVTRERAGICTQFAKAAAHVLTANRPDGPRVEIVAYRNHVYVLVGRSGGFGREPELPFDWTEDAGLVIVDPWAGSLGYATVYYNFASYPLKGMVNPIVLVAERPAA